MSLHILFSRFSCRKDHTSLLKLELCDYIAKGGDGKVGLVSAPLGDIAHLEVSQEKGYIIQSSAYIASTPKVKLDTEWQGFTKGLRIFS
ncbi:hypothetical protein B6U79_05025 [Candidatus Bathyarchaeota archaeon ex4484_231]|nr:MAG: hypothetical protein B6U79_05025 [Candidatus Bathyarchaeota archaeon ex4484_231]